MVCAFCWIFSLCNGNLYYVLILSIFTAIVTISRMGKYKKVKPRGGGGGYFPKSLVTGFSTS